MQVLKGFCGVIQPHHTRYYYRRAVPHLQLLPSAKHRPFPCSHTLLTRQSLRQAACVLSHKTFATNAQQVPTTQPLQTVEPSSPASVPQQQHQSDVLNITAPSSPAASTVEGSQATVQDGRSGWVHFMHTALSAYPIDLVASLAVLEMCSWAIIDRSLHAAHIQFSVLLPIAYLLSVPVRKVPGIKLVIAAPFSFLINFIAPPLREVNISDLRHYVSSWFRGASSVAVSTPVSAVAADTSNAGVFSRFLTWLRTYVDTHGTSLFVAYRFAGALIIASIWGLLEYGEPIQKIEHFVNKFGWHPDIQSAANKRIVIGAASCSLLSAAFFPLVLFLCPYLARSSYRTRMKIFNSVFRRNKVVTTTSVSK